ncbi:hypothetical protein WDV06_15235 [Streptomyces racemochromogenes]|uniref:Uncharacterized protein n=1 Tax=Streptomyces racemochromogenes TaxID=67353 RepID=A0ABW7PDI0_9ACTN
MGGPPEGDDARQPGPDAILASPAWPDIVAATGRLDARGLDVAPVVVDAHAAGAGVEPRPPSPLLPLPVLARRQPTSV